MAPDDFSISQDVTDDIATLGIAGDLNSRSRFDLECVLRDLLAAGVRRIIVRCVDLKQLDSGGLSTLLAQIPRLRPLGGDIVLAEINPTIKALFEIESLKKYFKVFETVGEARAFLVALPAVSPAHASTD